MMVQPRISQRQSLACRECTRRKRKCNKEIPCSRCRTLGLHCDREVIYLRRHINQNGPEISFLTSLREELQSSNPNRVSRAVQKITERVEFLLSGRADDKGGDANGSSDHSEQGLSLQASPSSGTAGDIESPGSRDDKDNKDNKDSKDKEKDPNGQDSLILTALEHIAWGRNDGSCYPHRRCACQYHRSWYELSSINSQSFQFARSRIGGTVQLPDKDIAKELVSFHIDYIAWHHNSIHAPTFLQQCNIFWETGECDQLQWIALYCAVLATSLFCLQHSRKYQSKYAYASGPVPFSAQMLFKTMQDVLFESNFLQNISLYSVQAIVISTEMAHNLGHSQLNATLISAAIRIAECLGVHKIEDKDDQNYRADTVLSQESWHEMLEREVGRRVWLQMVIQDHFAIPFTDTYGIHPNDYSTSMPSNADADLVPMPDAVPTLSSYTRVLATIALLMPELADGMGPLKARKPTHEQYEHVLAMDQKMRQVVRKIPKFFLQPDPELETRISWLCIARQTLAITAAEKIIMIHRPFMFRSFQSPVYSATRRTCVSASMTILREHNNITETGEVSLWMHTAFCITAALILCFEIMCTNKNNEQADAEKQKLASSQRAVYRDAVLGARRCLSSRTSDVLAQRGVLLINSIFSEAKSDQDLAASISFEEIVSKFSLDWAMLGLNQEIQQQQQQQAAIPYVTLQPGFDGSAGAAGGITSPDGEDFDVWFQHTFPAWTG